MKTYSDISVIDLVNNKFGKLFDYSQEEADDFVSRFDIVANKTMFNQVSKYLSTDFLEINNRVNSVIQFIQTLDKESLKHFEQYIQEFTDSNPNMLWNMLHEKDTKLYKTPEKFYEWISTLDDDALESYIYKAADNLQLHPDYVYQKQQPGTKIDILDGYITVSSSNLSALEKFKDRMLASNDCEYEHRIKKHGEITIHSYVFNMNKT